VSRASSALAVPFLDADTRLASPLPARDAVHVWRELAGGRCRVLFAADRDGTRHVFVVLTSPPPGDWSALGPREIRVVALAAKGCSQKAIALDLGVAFSTVSRILHDARRSLGLASLAELARAYRANFV
jgi:DNA-binding NarL/FixJ family response regulator